MRCHSVACGMVSRMRSATHSDTQSLPRGASVVICALACAAISGAVQSAPPTAFDPAGPTIHIEDVERFYKVYDAAGGHPTADQLQHDYIDPGSDGLHQFARMRKISGAAIAENLAKRPEVYSGAKRCMNVLPAVRQRVGVALRTLGRLYPEAQFPAVTIAVGRGKPVGVGSPVSGVQIGLEALCATDWVNPNVEDRFVHVIAHEYVHVQQVQALVDDEHPTVLAMSLIEGAAEFIAQLISGKGFQFASGRVDWGEGKGDRDRVRRRPRQDRNLRVALQQHARTAQGPWLLGWISDRQILLPASVRQAPGPSRNSGNDRSEGVPGQERLVSRHSDRVERVAT